MDQSRPVFLLQLGTKKKTTASDFKILLATRAGISSSTGVLMPKVLCRTVLSVGHLKNLPTAMGSSDRILLEVNIEELREQACL